VDPEAFYADVVEKYSRYVNPYLAKLLSFAGFGVEMYGEGCYIYDHEGKKYLDCLGGYGTFALGHRHPKVVEAAKNQLDKLPLSGKAFFSKPMCDLAEKLAQISPEGLQYSFVCNSGTEAVEAALKLAKATTGRMKVVSTNGAYHGKTIGALSTTGREKYRKPFEPLMPGVVFIEYGDIAAAENAIDEQTACMIVEPIQGEGGIHIPPDGYMAAIRRACDRTGALLIADEVQTCLGRTGDMFACNHDNISPDLMPLAKQVGGGVMPLGVLMGTPAVWEATFGQNPLIHTSTFGGNPVACAAGLAGIQVIEEEGLVERSRIMGDLFKRKLQDMASRHSDLVGEVRGRGLMIGVEFTMDEVGELTVAQMLMRGMCAAYTLNNPRVIRLEPPLIITEDQIDFAVQTLDESITETANVLAMIA
jgi:putrescine aminotransferase